MSLTAEFLIRVHQELENTLRGSGRTSKIIKRVKERNEILVCHNAAHANELSREYSIRTLSYSKYLSHPHIDKDACVFDHYVEYNIIQEKLKEVKELCTTNLR